jgi:fructose-1,6-bisphosphatase/inositol monophosphatase family enzyme
MECSESPHRKVTIIIEGTPADPVLSAPLSESSASLCRGGSVALTAVSAGAGAFEWYRNGQRLPDAVGATLTVTDAGAYHVATKTANACYAAKPSNTVVVTVHEPPPPPPPPHPR